MKTAIVYASVHHGNTKKIIDDSQCFSNRETLAVFYNYVLFIAQDSDKSHHVHPAQYPDIAA